MPFNNKQTVEINMHHAEYTVINHVTDLLGNRCDISEGSKGNVAISEFRPILLVSFLR